MALIDLSGYIDSASTAEPLRVYGKVDEVTGLIIKATGIRPGIGETCRIFRDDHTVIEAETVGFRGSGVLLMAAGELSGIRTGNRVLSTGKRISIKVGPELTGRIIDDIGNPIDGKGHLRGRDYPLFSLSPSPLKRRRIREPMDLGIKAINGLLTCGKGQRVGIMAGSGVGKSVLLGMIARYTAADVNVIGLIGERGREVREFIEKDLGDEGLARSVVVVSTAEQPALAKIRGAFTATAVAEYFRKQGKDVLLLMDSLSRIAMAQREIGLAAGEPPASKGYTPSVFALLPKLLERVGTAEGSGSITGLYTVLVEGDDLTEPVADMARAILDGHIVLSREIAMENHYPAIDVLRSISRVMPDIVDERHREYAGRFVEVLATYRKFEDMINLGVYREGSNPGVDQAIRMRGILRAYLMQDMKERRDFSGSVDDLCRIFGDLEAGPVSAGR